MGTIETLALPVIDHLLQDSHLVVALPEELLHPYRDAGVLTVLPMELFAGFILLSGLLRTAADSFFAASARLAGHGWPGRGRARPGQDQPGAGVNFESESQRELRRGIARMRVADTQRRPIAVRPAPACQA